MALQTIAGQGLWMPEPLTINTAVTNNLLIDATGEKAAFCGHVWNKDRGSKNITKVGFRFGGTVTKAGGSALTVSLQDVSLTVGPVMVPDETQDQTVAIANGDASFAANTWYQTAALSANRTVAFDELLAVVIEYDGGGRLGADAVTISSLSYLGGSTPYGDMASVLKTGGTWADNLSRPNVILEFDDGTFGTLIGAFPYSAYSNVSFKQDTAVSDEYALEFQVPWPCKVDGFWVQMLPTANTANFDVVLYDGTVAMANGTVSIDANATIGTASLRAFSRNFLGEVTLVANTTYRLAVKPTQTAANVTLAFVDVANANHWQAHAGGTSWRQTTRVDLGAWAAATTTRRPMMGIHVSALDDGASGGSRGTRIMAGHEGSRVY